MALRVGQRRFVHAVETVILIVHQAAAANERPQHAAEHALIVAVFCRRPGGEIPPHQVDDIDAAVGAPGPQAADHQLVVQDVVAHDVERQTGVDPLPDQIGFRRGQPRVAIAHQEASDGRIVHHQEALKQADAGIFVFDVAHVGAVVAKVGDRRARHVGGDVKAAVPAGIDRAGELKIDHGAVAVERRRAPQRKRNDVSPRRRTARLGHRDRRRIAAGFGVAQLDRALAEADGVRGLAGIEIRDLERVEHGEVLAMPHDIAVGLRDRLVIALEVRQRRDQRLLQAGDVRLAADEVLGERERRQPFALLEKSVEQQFLGDDIVRPDDDDGARFGDRLVVLAGSQQRANVLVDLRRDFLDRAACKIGHRQIRPRT